MFYKETAAGDCKQFFFSLLMLLHFRSGQPYLCGDHRSISFALRHKRGPPVKGCGGSGKFFFGRWRALHRPSYIANAQRQCQRKGRRHGRCTLLVSCYICNIMRTSLGNVVTTRRNPRGGRNCAKGLGSLISRKRRGWCNKHQKHRTQAQFKNVVIFNWFLPINLMAANFYSHCTHPFVQLAFASSF